MSFNAEHLLVNNYLCTCHSSHSVILQLKVLEFYQVIVLSQVELSMLRIILGIGLCIKVLSCESSLFKLVLQESINGTSNLKFFSTNEVLAPHLKPYEIVVSKLGLTNFGGRSESYAVRCSFTNQIATIVRKGKKKFKV
ncbi:hypothetical protein ACSBR2_039028 [Camellia fascicularis]